MTNNTKFKSGQSGNLRGRPRGSKDKRTEIRDLLKPHADKLIKKAVELAMNGDVAALRLCIDRLVSPIKPQGMPVVIDCLKGSLAQKGEAILTAAVNEC